MSPLRKVARLGVLLFFVWVSLAALAVVVDFVNAKADAETERIWRSRQPSPRHTVSDGRSTEIQEPSAGLPPPCEVPVVEVERLSEAMCRWLVRKGAPESDCERRDVSGLAHVLVSVVDDLDHRGRWVPLGREKAPAFLAAVAYYEVSFKWTRPRRGELGEVGIFQMHGVVAHRADRIEPAWRSDAVASTRATIEAMDWLRREVCGERGWMTAYASGSCRSRSDEVADKVADRFELTRWLLQEMER